MQMPSFQTWAGRKATALLNNHIEGTAQIDRVMVVFFNKVIIKDAVILGTPGDTLARINKLAVSFSPIKLLRGDLHFDRINIRGGVFNYWVEGPQGMSNLFRIFRIPNTPSTSKEPMVFPRLSLGELRIRDFRFSYYDPYVRKTGDPECIDFTDLDLSQIEVRANRIEMGPEGLFVRVHQVHAVDKSGFTAKNIRTQFSFIPGLEARMEDLYLDDGISLIKAHYFTMGFDYGSDWGDFLRKVRLGADFYDARLDFRTLGKIAPELKGNPWVLKINGKVNGPISRLVANQLRVQHEQLNVLVSGTIAGLPKIQNTDFSLQVHECTTDTRSIESLITCFRPDFNPGTLANFAPGIPLHFTGNTHGTLDALNVLGDVRSDIGTVQTELLIGNLLNKRGIVLDGTINTRNLDLHKVLQNDALGDLTAQVDARIGLPTQDRPMDVRLRNLKVDRLGCLGYDYQGIQANGTWRNHAIDARMVCHDPNVEFIAHTYVSSNRDSSRSIKAFIDMPIVDLAALHLDQRGSISEGSLMAMADLIQTPSQDWLGSLELKQLSYRNEKGSHKVDDITLISTQDSADFQMELISPMLNASLISDGSPLLVLGEVQRILIDEQFRPEKVVNSPAAPNFRFHVETADTRALCQIILPELYIAERTKLDISLNKQDEFLTELSSPAIALGSNRLRNITGKLSNQDSLLRCSLRINSLHVSGIDLQYAQADLEADHGLVHTELGFANSSALRNELFVSADVFLDRQPNPKDTKAYIFVNDSYLYLQDRMWEIRPFDANIGQEKYQINQLFLQSEDQEIRANGELGKQADEQLNLQVNNFLLDNLNSFFKQSPQIRGTLNGSATLSSLFSNPNIFVDLLANNVQLGEDPVGTLNIKSKWDQANNRLNLLVDQSLNGRHPLNVYGHYQPSNRFLNLTAEISELPLTYLNPFVKNFMTTYGGSLSGNFQLYGRTDRLNLTGDDCRFNRFGFTPTYTGVPYWLDGNFSVRENGISFDQIYITDSNESKARLEGSLNHKHFQEINLDTKLTFQNFQCLNIAPHKNNAFYGTANASGNIFLRGSLNNLMIDVTAATADNTSIHIPMSSSQSASQKDLLTFKSPQDLFQETLEQQLEIHTTQVAKKSNIDIRAKATVNPDAEILVEINKETGDVIRSKGSGTVDIEINPAHDVLDLRGDYKIQEGSYRFVLLGMVAKDFVVEEGGTVSFGGNIQDTRINLKANYNTKASIATLISDTTSVGTRRDVRCGISMTGSLLNPEISFDIEVPDLDPITKGRVETALSTEDKVLRQTISLLISGSFLPDEESGIVNTSTLLYSYTSEMVSNQLNNILRQLNIPLDLGLNYQQDRQGQDVFDVALSTQFFNNRVIVNGNVGNVAGAESNGNSNWVGNLETQIKLGKDGKLRATLFTHSADDYSNYLDNTQRTGIGFTYQDEFDSFRELWRNIFWSKKRREEYEMQQLIKAEQELIREEEEIKKRQQVNAPKESPYQWMGF